MIKLYVADVSAYEDIDFSDAEREFNKYVSDSAHLHIKEARSEKVKKERLFSYALLGFAIADTYKCDSKKEIVFERDKKPYFPESDIKFSVSHTDGAVAALIGDFDVGVDIEAVTDASNRTTDAFITRYGIDIPNESVGNISEMRFLIAKDSEFTLSDECVFSENKGEPTEKWTATEACLKLSGDGFCALSGLKTVPEGIRVCSIRIKANKREFSLSTAIYKK